MLVRRHTWSPAAQWSQAYSDTADAAAQLVLSFGPETAPPDAWFAEVQARWPAAQHVYCSGGGQIFDGTVSDDVTIVTAIQFGSTVVHPLLREGVTMDCSAALGTDVGQALRNVPDLRHVLLFTDGLQLNAARFLDTLNAELPDTVTVSGGMASNGIALTRSAVGLNQPPAAGRLIALGLAGNALDVRTGSVGGWDLFGPERLVTRADTSVVYELDGENALEVYKRYLGVFANELPGIALTFPLAVWQQAGGPMAVRTIIGIDDDTGALRFAGDIPEGSRVRLMRTTTDKLIHGAEHAARFAHGDEQETAAALTICISCIGRRAVMRSRVEEELDEVLQSVGGSPVIGFYSNGEIAPPNDGRTFAKAVLHNQTMTVTSIRER